MLKFLPLPCSVVGVAVDPIGLPVAVVVVVLLLLLLLLVECGDTDDSCRLLAGSSPAAAADPGDAADRGTRFDVGGESLLLLLNGVSTYSFVSLSFSGRGAASVTGDVAAGGKLVSKLGGPKMSAAADSDGRAAGGRRREKVLAGCTRL